MSNSLLNQHYQTLNERSQEKYTPGFGTTWGDNNLYQVTISDTVGPFARGLSIRVFFHEANTGPSQLVLNGVGPVAILRAGPSGIVPLELGDLLPDIPYDVTFNGTVWVVKAERSQNYQEVVRLGASELQQGFEVFEPGMTDYYCLLNKNMILPGTIALTLRAKSAKKLRGSEPILYLPPPASSLPSMALVQPATGPVVVWRLFASGLLTLEGNIKPDVMYPVTLSPYLSRYPEENQILPSQ